jgi:uncharacterized protein
MLLTGMVGGMLAGLLGVGGGIVIVPVLEIVLAILGVDAAVRMHVAVATSQATIILTSISSARAHFKRQSVDIDLVKRWGLLMFAGAVLGVVVAGHVHGRVLSGVFASVALLVAIKMMLPLDDRPLAQEVPRTPTALVLPGTIGALSSMMGIGGGTLSVPIMTLLNQPIHRAVGTAALFGLVISAPATIGFIIAGMHHGSLPAGSLGFVNLIGFAFIAPTTMLAAPWGARIAHGLDRRQLSLLFGVFLFIVAVRMFYQAMHAG